MADWFNNGEAIEHVSADDRGFQYGDGIFETIAIRDGEPRLWQYHMQRLSKGCELLKLRMPAESILSAGVTQALRQVDEPAAYRIAKIIVTAGAGVHGYGRTSVPGPKVLFGVFHGIPQPPESYRIGIDTVLCQTRLASNSVTAGLKTLNRLEQVLARMEFQETPAFEGLTMDADDNVICGTMSNVFFVNDQSISTPALDRCGVKGVMRRHIIEALHKCGIDTAIHNTNLAEMKNQQEVFISNSQIGVIPVRSCMNMHWPVGEVTKKVMAILADSGISECRS